MSVDTFHSHDFHTHSQQNAAKVKLVFGLTLVTMLAEIAVGSWAGSMALLADGWHMGTHAAAFAIAMFAYHYARKHAHSADFSFGTGKVQFLGGFASAVALAVVALMMAIESIERLIQPESIRFNEAIIVAFLGLIINVLSALILFDSHHHGHNHEHHHHDHNLKAAYFHVLADALTSVLAIVALFAGRGFGWLWLDAAMGVVGAIIISRWAYNLMSESADVLLDKTVGDVDAIKGQLENACKVQVLDLHVWTVAQNHRTAIVSVIADTETGVDQEALREALHNSIPSLSHLTVELISKK